MTFTQHQLTKQAIHIFKWKDNELKRSLSLTCMKFGLIFMLYLLGFDISAQTAEQNAIADAPINGTVKIGSFDWYVVRTKSMNNEDFAMLVAKNPIGSDAPFSDPNIQRKNICGSPVVWTPETNSGSDKQNWHNPDNWTPALVPLDCNDVYIPGNNTHYPVLTSPAVCRNIYFIHGAELGRPDLLAYEKAHVQYNFGLLQSELEQITDKNDISLLFENNSTKRLLYSASASAAPIERKRWHMLSSPLQGVVTGDLGFGGFPLTFLMKFDPVEKENQKYSVGNWTTPYTSMTEPVAANITDGFAFYMYGYKEGESSERNLGCTEIGRFGQLNESNYLLNREGEGYGLGKTNGILELPFFADSTNLYAHRTQVYNEPTSTFYYINDGVYSSLDFNKFTGTTKSVTRKDYNGNYRFSPEFYDTDNKQWTFLNPIPHSTSDLSDGDEFLVGNPYMSSIDIVAFLKDNLNSIYSEFKIWDGTNFISCSVDTETGAHISTEPADLRYIAPSQGFFLKYKEGNEVRFDVTKISTVRSSETSFNLRSAQETKEENLLRIKAENQWTASYAVIAHQEKASNGYIKGEDVQKLFSPLSYVPEIYLLADDVPVDINFINSNSDAVILIPLGIKTEQLGEIRLTFTGMDHYVKASKIELVDALENRTVDLTGKSNYTYTYNHTEKGILNGRFLLRIGTSMTALPNTVSDNLNVYGNSKGIFVISSPSDPVLQMTVYDFQGRKVYESTSGAGYYPLQENSDHSPMIVKAVTKNQVKTMKINF